MWPHNLRTAFAGSFQWPGQTKRLHFSDNIFGFQMTCTGNTLVFQCSIQYNILCGFWHSWLDLRSLQSLQTKQTLSVAKFAVETCFFYGNGRLTFQILNPEPTLWTANKCKVTLTEATSFTRQARSQASNLKGTQGKPGGLRKAEEAGIIQVGRNWKPTSKNQINTGNIFLSHFNLPSISISCCITRSIQPLFKFITPMHCTHCHIQ